MNHISSRTRTGMEKSDGLLMCEIHLFVVYTIAVRLVFGYDAHHVTN